MSTPNDFFGVPIHRNRHPAATRVPQRPLSALRPLFEAVLQDPEIAAFGWSQSGPVPSGDGRTAGLRIGPPWFRTTTDHAVRDLRTLSLEHQHPSLGGHRYDESGGGTARRRLPYQGPDRERYGRAKRLAEALESGAFDRALVEFFGGGRGATEVTVWPDRIRVVEHTLA
ncbi:hypothetical protein ACIRBX_08165 [Kitasatospora sp. NPDC096147]|uniref:hypothetical protein n=1 Tax=Kitasatospora sp. NPDC096147 TaxID=3364093 RepID=UPI0037F4FFCB